jgi:hypothetical protein
MCTEKKNQRTSRPHPALLAAIFEDCAAPLKGLELESLWVENGPRKLLQHSDAALQHEND